MVVGDNKSTATKNAGELMAILIAMAMHWYDAGNRLQRGWPRAHMLGLI